MSTAGLNPCLSSTGPDVFTRVHTWLSHIGLAVVFSWRAHELMVAICNAAAHLSQIAHVSAGIGAEQARCDKHCPSGCISVMCHCHTSLPACSASISSCGGHCGRTHDLELASSSTLCDAWRLMRPLTESFQNLLEWQKHYRPGNGSLPAWTGPVR